jgi:hypothetical protein
MRTPKTLAATLAAVLIAGGLVIGCHRDTNAPGAAPATAPAGGGR